MKVGLYLDNSSTPLVDLRRPDLGNPGIGGSQWQFAALAYHTRRLLPGAADLVLFANHPARLPEDVQTAQASDCLDAALKSQAMGCDIFVYRPTGGDANERLLDALDRLALKVVVWAHTTPGPRVLRRLAQSRQVKRIVCVSRQQWETLRDHEAFSKAAYVYNGIDTAPYHADGQQAKKNGLVVFMGNLVPRKGFHLLAEVWPAIVRRVPHARLAVIGNAQLYDRSKTLGPWGLAEEPYETRLRKYLSGPDGKPHESVSFLGLLGLEKTRVLQEAMVGVVNPSGIDETFCLAATEFQAAGTPVVSSAHLGLLDTVAHGVTGLLGKTTGGLRRNIVHLLENAPEAVAMGRAGSQFVEQKFNYDRICRKWLQLLLSVSADTPDNFPEGAEPPQGIPGLARHSLRRLKESFPPARGIPSLYEMSYRIECHQLVRLSERSR